MEIIGENNKVNYGVFDELLEFNHERFRLLDFFGKEIKGFRRNWALHAFNYLGIVGPDYLIGLAAVRLGYLHTVFAYLYDYEKGMLLSYDTKGPGGGALKFPINPDVYAIQFKKGVTRLTIDKTHWDKRLSLDAVFDGRLSVSFSTDYGLASHEPLRVLNPSEPFRWTFTEKCSPIRPDGLKVALDGKDITPDPDRTTVLYDWSGGYMRRETNWFWAAFCDAPEGGPAFGANFAALVNEAYYSENAFWIDNKRTRVTRAIFDFDLLDPYKPWRIFDEAGTVDITFTPRDERGEKINAAVLKTFFRQFFGTFEGWLKPKGKKAVKFEKVHGLTEFHRALW